MNKQYKLANICLLIILTQFCTSSQKQTSFADENKIKSQGIGEIQYGQVGRARDDAIKDAKRQAVAKVLGTMVSSSTSIESGVFQDQSVLSKSEGYIESFTIVDEGKKSSDVYYVEIIATVAKAKLKASLDQSLSVAGRPEFMVVIKQTGNISSGGKQMQNALEEAFIAEGYPLLDKKTVAKLMKKKSALIAEALDGDSSAAQNFGLEAGAQIIIFGDAEINNAGKIMGSSINSIQLTSAIRIIDVTNGKILSTNQENGTTGHINPQIGASIIAEKVSNQMVRKATPRIMRLWQPNKGIPIELLITGLDYGASIDFNDFLLGLRGIKELNSRGTKKNISKLQIIFEGTSDVLAERIYKVGRKTKFKIKVKQVEPNNIVLEVTK